MHIFDFYYGADYSSANGNKNTMLGIIPLAATAQYTFDSGPFAAADIGYAVFVGEYASGGSFYYQPKFGYNINDRHELYLGYRGLKYQITNISSVNLGYMIRF